MVNYVKNLKFYVLVFTCCLVFKSNFLEATTIKAVNDKELIEEADRIVFGKIKSIKHDHNGKIIYRTIKVKVSDFIKGQEANGSDDVIFALPGGIFNGEEMKAE